MRLTHPTWGAHVAKELPTVRRIDIRRLPAAGHAG